MEAVKAKDPLVFEKIIEELVRGGGGLLYL
jgi:hypothetical protein